MVTTLESEAKLELDRRAPVVLTSRLARQALDTRYVSMLTSTQVLRCGAHMCTSVDTVGSGSPVRSAIQHSGVTNLPSTIWLVTTGMQAVPKRLKEVVAESESLWRRMSRIVLPFSAPSISTATFLSLINGGGVFLVALVIMLSPSQTPAPLALYNFVHFGTTQYGQIVAFSTLFSLPLFILYVVVPASSRAGSRSPARSTGDVDAHFRATDPASETPCRYSA